MKSSINFIFLMSTILSWNASADFWDDRNTFFSNEACQLIGSSIELTEDEQKVNDILMDIKFKEYDEGFADPSKFLPSFHFFQTKSRIEESEVFKFIQKVPKGASLHSHSSAMLSFDALYNLTYSDGLYGCDDNGKFNLHFFFGTVSDDCEWKLLSDWRTEDTQFDDFLRSKLTLVVDDPATTYDNINTVWNKFNQIFSLTHSLFDYRGFLHDYLYQVLQEFHDDNVMYLELRGSFRESFDSNGTTYDTFQTIQFYLDTLTEFRNENPDFMGFRVIYAKSRNVNNKTMQDHIAEYLKIQKKYPDLIAGFDLVGQEDIGQPLSAYANKLLSIANRTKFFFHAGETNWYGASTDLNLIDAVLLNTSRIGHGFAITKHPDVLDVVKEREIAIELNPLSNQVLKLVDDLRNHVGASLIAGGFPVVVTCDDPTFWGAKGLSYDWYMVFMAMTPRDGDLRILKQLALNSFLYSSLTPEDKSDAIALLEERWNDFIHDILQNY
jgi:adenosine deaminase CECR1